MKANSFFSKNGLTPTSANHIANLAKEYIKSVKKEVNNLTLYSTFVSTIGSTEQTQVGFETKKLDDLETKLNDIAKATALIAWLREAIKSKELYQTDIRNLTIEEWAKDNNITLPEVVEVPDFLTEEKIVEKYSVGELVSYVEKQAFATVFGQYIHPDNCEDNLSDARDMYYSIKEKPVEIIKTKTGNLVYTYESSYDKDSIEEVFFKLQDSYRKEQSEFNQISFDIQNIVEKDCIEKTAEYNKMKSDYRSQMDKYNDSFELYKKEKLKEIMGWKILIPNNLREVYEKIKS